MEGWNKRTYRKISNISLPECKPPKNKAKGEFQVQLLNLSKTGIYTDSNRIKRYYDGFRQVLKQNKGDFGLERHLFAYNSDI